jgi:predicted short-subunit dehydrogenase-like oxidoreductase (DUF2520 family)
MADTGRKEEEVVKNDKLSVAIVGYGRVGKVLTRAFIAAGYSIAGVVSRHPVEACFPVFSTIGKLPANIDFLLLCVRDSDIEDCRSKIDDWIGSQNPKSKIQNPKLIVAHTAGALSAEILAPLRAVGALIMAWHPMQTFTGSEGIEILKGITFGIDGDEEAVEIGEQIARELGGIPFRVAPEARAIYHLGAVVSCNLLAALVGNSVDLLKAAGMDEKRALQALSPLMTQTMHNIARLGLPEAITGPLKRGDAETIRKHLTELDRFPETRKIYCELSLALLKRLEESDLNAEIIRLLKS